MSLFDYWQLTVLHLDFGSLLAVRNASVLDMARFWMAVDQATTDKEAANLTAGERTLARLVRGMRFFCTDKGSSSYEEARQLNRTMAELRQVAQKKQEAGLFRYRPSS